MMSGRVRSKFYRSAKAEAYLLRFLAFTVLFAFGLTVDSPKGRHCPTAPVQLIAKNSDDMTLLVTPNVGDDEFVECVCDEERETQESEVTSVPTVELYVVRTSVLLSIPTITHRSSIGSPAVQFCSGRAVPQDRPPQSV